MITESSDILSRAAALALLVAAVAAAAPGYAEDPGGEGGGKTR